MLRRTRNMWLAERNGHVAVFGTNSDTPDHHDVLVEIWEEDVYHLDGLDFTGRVVVDIGAHIGAFTVRAGCMGAHVVAVEPWHESLPYLKDNCGELDVTIIEAAAVGDDSSRERLMSRIPGTGMGVLGMGEEACAVGVISPHEILAAALAWSEGSEDETIAYLKVDIEGGEYELFASPEMPELLARCERVGIETHAGAGANVGALIESLLDTHHVDAFGHPSRGGMIQAWRY